MIATLSCLIVLAVLVLVFVKTQRRLVNVKPPTDEDRLAAWEKRLGEWRAEERRRAARGRVLFQAGMDDALDAGHYLTGAIKGRKTNVETLRKKKLQKTKLSLVPSRSPTGIAGSAPPGATCGNRPRATRGSDNAA